MFFNKCFRCKSTATVYPNLQLLYKQIYSYCIPKTVWLHQGGKTQGWSESVCRSAASCRVFDRRPSRRQCMWGSNPPKTAHQLSALRRRKRLFRSPSVLPSRQPFVNTFNHPIAEHPCHPPHARITTTTYVTTGGDRKRSLRVAFAPS